MKRFYDWWQRFYGHAEPVLHPILDEAVKKRILTLEHTKNMSAIDYGCGSGMLTLKLAPLFQSVVGIDQSTGMLTRARQRAEEAGLTIAFREGSLLEIDEATDSVDWVFISFALHLFPPNQVEAILASLLRVARQGVMVIDHPRKIGWALAIAEWAEGSWYDRFCKIDFAAVARQIGAASFEETAITKAVVLTFEKGRG
jgi:ubiquinone/menaquinone biosynthesis C-methylase UbiE